MIIYAAVNYIGETDTGFSARYVAGFTTNYYYASIFKLQNPDCVIDILEGDTLDDIRAISIENYGYDLIGDETSELKLWTTENGVTSVITTEELVYTTIGDLDVYSQAVNEFINSYLVLEHLVPYFKDDTFKNLLRHVFTGYITDVCRWLYVGSGELEDSPIDLIQGLINQKYMTPIDELGDDVVR